MGGILKAVVNVGPELIRTVGAFFDSSEETEDEPGDVANLGALMGKAAARFIPDATEDKVAEWMIALGEAGEFLRAAGRALKAANPPVEDSGV